MMMMKGFELWKKILPFVKNKFLLTIAIFALWMLIFDNSNWIDTIGELRIIHGLKQEKEYYQKKIETDRVRLQELRTDNENLEKFAREQYFMKKPNEEIFVVDE